VILRKTKLEDISQQFGSLLAEAISRVRQGQLTVEPGFDGQYGLVKIFNSQEKQKFALF